MGRIYRFCIFTAFSLLFAVSLHAEALTSYHIGNSLTWDARVGEFPALSAQRGIEHTTGRHLRCGRSLPFILRNPSEQCHEDLEFGTWPDAAPGHQWDVVTLQLYPDKDATLGSEVEAAVALIDTVRSNPANADTRFIVYGAWPNQIDTDSYEEAWLAPTDPDNLDTPGAHSRAYQLAAFERIAAARPDLQIDFLSAGEMFYQADLLIRDAVSSGSDWLGFTDISELYADEWHMSSRTGRWASGLAMWTAVTGEDPLNLEVPEGSFHPSLSTNDLQREGLADFVAEMMDSIFIRQETNPDCTGDGFLDARDLACVETIRTRDAVIRALNTSVGDLDGNGDISFADFVTLARNLGTGATAYSDGNIDMLGTVSASDLFTFAWLYSETGKGAQTIPEPSSSPPLLLLGTLIAIRRTRRGLGCQSGFDENR